eukprot:TRINITY_DN50088_c0_g1_i1.p1 TRINITY_DN50088_c0_g1~~TRINITY_DN50088_c0_g1_i1.p1  ORF type:complete len:479 (-),score=28.53 TRINITY_DN50088_c0_g1_i1:345-1781(-)
MPLRPQALTRLPYECFSSHLQRDHSLHQHLAGCPAVVDLTDSDSFRRSSRTKSTSANRQLFDALAGVHLQFRSSQAVARSGGAFRASNAGCGSASQRFEEWVRSEQSGRGTQPLVFDTRRNSEVNKVVWNNAGVAVPLPLRTWSRSPIVTLGCTVQACDSKSSQQSVPSGGLPFHQHERSWLLLLSGMKRWYFLVGEVPSTALKRVSEEKLLMTEDTRSSSGDTILYTHDQCPGECILVPDGVWHCTYNMPGSTTSERDQMLVAGLGGLGACGDILEYFAAQGDIDSLQAAGSGDGLSAAACRLARVAAEQAQINVLRFLFDAYGATPLLQGDANGATPLHVAAGAGHVDAVRYLIERGANVNQRDVHGATPAHWVARSGDSAVLGVIRDNGGDLEAVDDVYSCRPLHLLASEGHIEAVRWVVNEGHADPGCRDAFGRQPCDWAAAAGHNELSVWLQEACDRSSEPSARRTGVLKTIS